MHRTARLPLGWVASSYQLADILTKPQDPARWWESFRSRLLVPINLSEGASTNNLLAKDRKTSVKPKDCCMIIPNAGEFVVNQAGLPVP